MPACLRFHPLHHATTAAGLALALLLTGCGQPSADELLTQGRKALEQRDAPAAVLHLKSALAEAPQRTDTRFWLGQALLLSGDAQGASVELGKAVQGGHDPDAAVPLHARALLALSESRRLLELYGKTSLKAPEAQAALDVELAQALQRTGKLEEAEKLAAQALDRAPGSLAPELLMARIEAANQRLDAARARVTALTQRYPQDGAVWRLQGDLALAGDQSDRAAAQRAFEKAVAVEPKSAESHLARVGFLMAEGQPEAAEKALKDAQAQGVQHFGLRFYAAALALEQGKLDSAFEQIQQLLKAAPDHPAVLGMAGQVELLRGNLLPAESNFSRAIAQGANTPRLRLLLAQTHLRLDDPTRAVQVLQPLLDDASPDARVHALLGEAYNLLGETRKAEAAFRRAAQIDPKDTRIRTRLAMQQVRQGQDAEGLLTLRELAQNSEDGLVDTALISVLARKGDYKAAHAAIDALERKRPNDGSVPLLRANVLRIQGQDDAARAALETALQRDPKQLAAALQLARDDLKAGRKDAALARVKGVAQADPEQVLPQLAYLDTRLQTGEAAAALLPDLQALIQKHPKVMRARAALIRLQQAEGDTAAALKSAQDAVSALPQEAEALELLGALQTQQRDFALARATWTRLAELRPRAAEAWLRLADLEMRAGQPKQALAAVQSALRVQDRNALALSWQVRLESELGNHAAAQRLAREVGQRSGLEALGAALEGDVAYAQQQHDLAAQSYRRAVSRSAALPDVPSKLHRALRASGKPAEAERFAQEWLKAHERDAAFIAYLGDTALADRKDAEARSRYELALQLAPKQPALLNNLAWLHLQAGDGKKAEGYLEQARRLAPRDPSIGDTQAEWLARQGRHDDALVAQRKALTDAKGQESLQNALRLNLAKRLLDAGRRDEAQTELRTLQGLGNRFVGQGEVTALLAKAGATPASTAPAR